jgi:phage FluMu protein Com
MATVSVPPKTGATGAARRSTISSDELTVYCPKCKTLETLEFTKDGLTRTQKFTQENGGVYHDCGSSEPCRLYRAF